MGVAFTYPSHEPLIQRFFFFALLPIHQVCELGSKAKNLVLLRWIKVSWLYVRDEMRIIDLRNDMDEDRQNRWMWRQRFESGVRLYRHLRKHPEFTDCSRDDLLRRCMISACVL